MALFIRHAYILLALPHQGSPALRQLYVVSIVLILPSTVELRKPSSGTKFSVISLLNLHINSNHVKLLSGSIAILAPISFLLKVSSNQLAHKTPESISASDLVLNTED